MAWKFNAVTQEIVWVKTVSDMLVADGNLDLASGDLQIDTGLRDNESSILDQGSRLI